MAEWYETFFSGPYRDLYAPLIGPAITQQQVDAIRRWLELRPGQSALDLCCGHGRHAIALAAQGLMVTGQDLHAPSLDEAANQAREAGVEVQWRQGDMRQVPETDHFDAVVNLFSSFGFFAEDDDNVAVLKAAAKALKPGGRFLIDINNRDAALLAGMNQRLWEPADDGRILLEERRYDPLSGRIHVRLAWHTESVPHFTDQWLRLYTLPELIHLIRSVGLAPTGVWGDYDGSDFDLSSPRLIVRAVKPDL